VIPCARDNRVWEAGVGAEQQIIVRCQRPQLLDLVGREVRAIRDPDRAVFQRVHRVLVVNRRVIDAAVLPDDVVLSADRRVLSVDNRTGDVLTGGVARGLHCLEQLTLCVQRIRDRRYGHHENDSGAAPDERSATRPLFGGCALGGFSSLSLLVLCFRHYMS